MEQFDRICWSITACPSTFTYSIDTFSSAGNIFINPLSENISEGNALKLMNTKGKSPSDVEKETFPRPFLPAEVAFFPFSNRK